MPTSNGGTVCSDRRKNSHFPVVKKSLRHHKQRRMRCNLPEKEIATNISGAVCEVTRKNSHFPLLKKVWVITTTSTGKYEVICNLSTLVRKKTDTHRMWRHTF